MQPSHLLVGKTTSLLNIHFCSHTRFGFGCAPHLLTLTYIYLHLFTFTYMFVLFYILAASA